MAKSQAIPPAEIQKRALAEIEKHLNGLTSGEVQIAIFGDTKDADEYRRRQQRLSFQLKHLEKQKRIIRSGGRMGVWKVFVGRPTPEVADVPKRTYTKRNGQGGASAEGSNGGLRGYIIREIRSKLDELERLG